MLSHDYEHLGASNETKESFAVSHAGRDGLFLAAGCRQTKNLHKVAVKHLVAFNLPTPTPCVQRENN